MELFRTAANPWGQEVLIGIAWGLMWVAVILGVAFVVGHAIYVGVIVRPQERDATAAPPGFPEKVERHPLGARLFHWLMAIAMFALLVTAFFPVVGIQFAWVTIHWIAGLLLLATILFHVVHSTARQDFRSMVVDTADLAEGKEGLQRFFHRNSAGAETAAPGQGETPVTAGRAQTPPAGKYPLDHKLYHHAAALVSVVAILTGLLMMLRIDTPLWAASPYFLSDGTWGVLYVLHGLSGVALITLVVAHVYFAARPEKRWMTRAMVRGWITQEEFLAHHDPRRWVVAELPAATSPPAGPTSSPAGTEPGG